MKIFIETVNLSSFIFNLNKVLNCSKLFYINGNTRLVKLIDKFFVDTEKIQFRLIDVRNSKGNLTRNEIPNNLLHPHYEKFLRIFQKTNSYTEIRYNHFLVKSLVEGNRLEETSMGRFCFIDQLIKLYTKDEYIGFINSNPLFKLSDLVKKSKIEIQYNPFIDSDISLHNIAKSFLKNLLYRSLRLGVKFNNSESSMILIDDRGTIIDEIQDETGKSPLHVITKTSIRLDEIAVRKSNLDEKEILYCTRKGINIIDEFVLRRYLRRDVTLSINNSFLKNKDLLNQLILSKYKWDYIFEYDYHYTLYKYHHIKLILTWYRFNQIHLVQKHAINDLGGLLAVRQVAFQGTANIGCVTHADIFFGFSKYQAQVEESHFSQIENYVIVGYPSEYKNIVKIFKNYEFVRKNILANGAKKIVAMFDENSLDDSRWHTGHDLQREHYTRCINELLENPSIGFVFKPKYPKNLRERLGDVSVLLDQAIQTGRCYILDQESKHGSSVSPLEATSIADLVIHSCADAGSCAVESALVGKKTIAIDLEGWDKAIWYEFGEGNVVFRDWPSALAKLREWSELENYDSAFGDCSKLLDHFDPFQDGLAAERTGSYLSVLYTCFEKGADPDAALFEANKAYQKKWGKNMVLSVN